MLTKASFCSVPTAAFLRQAIFFVGSLLLLLSATGCQSAIEPSALALTETRTERDSLAFTLRLERTRLRQLDTLRGAFEVWNRSSRERVFEFLNQQQLGYELQRPTGEVLERWPMLVQPATSRMVLPPNQRCTLTLLTPLIRWATGEPLPKGRFWLIAYLLDDHSPRLRLAIEIE